jgi:transposase-like protein
VSTRSVDELAQVMAASGVSKSQVSRLVSEIDDKVRRLQMELSPIFGDGSSQSGGGFGGRGD